MNDAIILKERITRIMRYPLAMTNIKQNNYKFSKIKNKRRDLFKDKKIFMKNGMKQQPRLSCIRPLSF